MIVGIDLGTTNSLIAYFDGENGAKIIPNRLGEKLTPSVVSIGDDGTVYVGQTAKERRITHPYSTVEVFKRDMGSKREWRIEGKTYTPTELSALVLKNLKEDAEAYLGCEIKEAVISVPAYFSEQQRKATKIAGELAGLKVDRLISEPTAAALAYGVNENEEGKFLVFDLGGGTFDVSLIEYSNRVMEVHCVAGDNFLGGEDFTRVIYNMFLRKNNIYEPDLTDDIRNHIAKQAELCKLALSDEIMARMQCKINDEMIEMSISRDEFKEACGELFTRLQKPIARSLKDAKLSIEEIDRILMVGGSTRMSVVREYVEGLFKRKPDYDINADEAIVIGACIQAAMKEKNKLVEDLVMTDVCPYTMGIGCSNRNGDTVQYVPIIQRNSTLPISRTHNTHTIWDYQPDVRISVYQGEHRKLENNLMIGEFVVKVPPDERGKQRLNITFTYDINALLEVMVRVESTGEVTKQIFMGEDCNISLEDAQKRFKELEYLKLPPREQEQNKMVLFKAEEMYQELLSPEREKLEYFIEGFEEALNTQDVDVIDEAREVLEDVMKDIEASIF